MELTKITYIDHSNKKHLYNNNNDNTSPTTKQILYQNILFRWRYLCVWRKTNEDTKTS